MDVKAKNAATGNKSTLCCFLCNATSSVFNDLDTLATKFPTKEENLVYGSICDLHAWMRAFDAINSLSDKLIAKKWRPGKDQKDTVESRKNIRNAAYKDQMNLLVDAARSGGVGNSNTGNTARRAFQDEATFAQITGVDQGLIHDIHTLLIGINVDIPLNLEKFRAKGYATAKKWVELYPWYHMPVTLHQLFIHAWESIPQSSLPLRTILGVLQQELQERSRTSFSQRLKTSHHSGPIPLPIRQSRSQNGTQAPREAAKEEVTRPSSRCPRLPRN